MLIALAISAMLLTATMMAIDASFVAYGETTEEAATHATTRLFAHRLLQLIRTSTEHAPLLTGDVGVTALGADAVESTWIEMIDPDDRVIRIEWRSADEQIWLIISTLTGTQLDEQPMIDGVTDATFTIYRTRNSLGYWTLSRCTIDMTVQPGADAEGLSIESGTMAAIRIVASTKPRKLD